MLAQKAEVSCFVQFCSTDQDNEKKSDGKYKYVSCHEFHEGGNEILSTGDKKTDKYSFYRNFIFTEIYSTSKSQDHLTFLFLTFSCKFHIPWLFQY